ncbi:endonuclease/exonuclease/phosphatase family protein [Anaeromyxobacter dehalogenans]|uniref:endonuclease/exonuclease/phosphatase family protein n=1 Tax=Anaeromyxobacter dehalogenans TaxID=161493 RepID=UPI000051C361|nr:endonuclease/exonuclease/phosphatase family protein [Anaeromyxobacter dehalogenans]
MRFRVVTWNVHGLRGAGRRPDPERIARVLDDIGADVAGLQEVGASLPGADAHAAEALARLTGLNGAFGPTLQHARGFAYGNAILSRHPIDATRTYDLSVPGREPRGCLRADVVLGPMRVHVFAAHLGLHWRERRRQAAALLSADILRDAALSHPLVLVGDFNSPSDRSAVPRWLRRTLTDCAVAAGRPAATFPSAWPLLRLDRAYVDAALRVVACEVVRTPRARRASDHLPLVVELELTEAARRPPAPRPVEAPGVRTRTG